MPYGLDFIAMYSSWVGGTSSYVYKDPAQGGCGQKPNGRAVVLPVCLTCVPIALLVDGGSATGCVWNGRQQLLREIDHASPSC